MPQLCNKKIKTICCPEKIKPTTVKPNRISDESKLLNFKIFISLDIILIHILILKFILKNVKSMQKTYLQRITVVMQVKS